MSDFLTRLVQRQAGTLATIQPRTRSMFAPAMDRPEPPTPDLPVIDGVASSGEQRQPAEAPRHSIAPMPPLAAFLHAQRRIEAPVDEPSIVLPETGTRGTEPSNESPVVKVTAVPSAALGEGAAGYPGAIRSSNRTGMQLVCSPATMQGRRNGAVRQPLRKRERSRLRHG
ncbi:MAG: hypothetical protein IPO99_19450 [Nitrospira sp.]|nr:hypothetical protein [Nitrospira sp.]